MMWSRIKKPFDLLFLNPGGRLVEIGGESVIENAFGK